MLKTHRNVLRRLLTLGAIIGTATGIALHILRFQNNADAAGVVAFVLVLVAALIPET